MKYLISRCVDIDRKTLNGETALHIAAHNDDAVAVEILLTAGIRKYDTNDNGRTAYDIAVEGGKYNALAVLQRSYECFGPEAPVHRPFGH